jgi:predicted nucleic acid-binding protein
MVYINWQPSIEVESPIYVDANIFVGTIVRNHRLYRTCVKLIGKLLANRSHILVSPLSIQESLWAIVRLSYCDLTGQRRKAHFDQGVYKKWCSKIFERYGTRIVAATSMLQDWAKEGLPVEVIPKTEMLWSRILDLTPRYMRECRLTPADAFHLALAETHARTFVTADSDFETVPKALPEAELTILHLIEELPPRESGSNN